ncbi:MAG: 50S ribosomal protein L7/L12 [bacterium]
MAEEVKTDAAEAAVEEKKEVPEKFTKLVAELDKMSVLDLSEFVKTLEDHYGVSAAAPMAVAGAAAPAEAAEAAEEKSSFNIFLAATGEKKIDVIKAVREITGLGLAESKAVADGAPVMVKENATKDEADDAKTKLEAAGATVELQ